MPTVLRRGRPDAELLKNLGGSAAHNRDRALIVTAILEDAQQHNGRVSANRVRLALCTGDRYIVHPQLVGATYALLARSNILTAVGREPNRDTRNTAHPVRVWQLSARWAA